MHNFLKKLSNSTYLINICPLCKSKKFKSYKFFYINRYTEEFSNLINIQPEYLMKNVSQKTCIKCNLIFKKKWFKSKILRKIYNKHAPLHPNGWDIYSNKFTKKYLLTQIKKLKLSESFTKKNILKRTIISILQSINDHNFKVRKTVNKFINYVDKEKINKIEDEKNEILKLITVPKNFSRFTGFNNQEFYSFIKKNVRNLKNYTEIGCPLWGLYKTVKKENIKTYFIKPNYDFFWGKNCKKKSVKCIDKLDVNTKYLNLHNLKGKYDYIGIYNYIDHINNLSKFLDIIFKNFRHVGIIQEDKNRGYPIQHNYGINYKCMKYIAKKYKKKIIQNNNLFGNSKYNFYLFL